MMIYFDEFNLPGWASHFGYIIANLPGMEDVGAGLYFTQWQKVAHSI